MIDYKIFVWSLNINCTTNFQNQGENIFEFHIMNDGLYKKTVDGKLEVINPIEKGLTKIHRDFLNDNHNYVFQNTGTFNTFLDGISPSSRLF